MTDGNMEGAVWKTYKLMPGCKELIMNQTNLPHILLEVNAYSKLHQEVLHIFLDSEKTITIFTNETSFALTIRGIGPLTPQQIFQQFYYSAALYQSRVLIL